MLGSVSYGIWWRGAREARAAEQAEARPSHKQDPRFHPRTFHVWSGHCCWPCSTHPSNGGTWSDGETEAQGRGRDSGLPPWLIGPSRGHVGLGGGVHREQIKEARGAGQSGEARAHRFPLLFGINRLLCSCIFLKERRPGLLTRLGILPSAMQITLKNTQ